MKPVNVDVVVCAPKVRVVRVAPITLFGKYCGIKSRSCHYLRLGFCGLFKEEIWTPKKSPERCASCMRICANDLP